MAELDLVTPGMMMTEITPRLGSRAMAAAPLWRAPSGLGTIVAIALARLGRPVDSISRVGDNRIDDWMIGALAIAGVGMRGWRSGTDPSHEPSLPRPARHARPAATGCRGSGRPGPKDGY